MVVFNQISTSVLFTHVLTVHLAWMASTTTLVAVWQGILGIVVRVVSLFFPDSLLEVHQVIVRKLFYK